MRVAVQVNVCQIKTMQAKIAVTTCGRETVRTRADISAWTSDVNCPDCIAHRVVRTDVDDYRESIDHMLRNQ